MREVPESEDRGIEENTNDDGELPVSTLDGQAKLANWVHAKKNILKNNTLTVKPPVFPDGEDVSEE